MGAVNRLRRWLLALVGLLSLVIAVHLLPYLERPGFRAAEENVQWGDIVVNDGGVHVIEDQTFVLEGNIIVDSGTLIIRNSDVTLNSHYKNQYWVRVYSNATFLVENSILREGPVSGLSHCGNFGGIDDFRCGETVITPEGDNAQVILRNSTSEPRIGPEIGAAVTIDSSYLSILFLKTQQSVRTTVTNSNFQMLHIWLHGETEENVEFSGLRGGENQSMHLSVEGAVLDIENTSVQNYSLSPYVVYGENNCRKNITVRDSTLDQIFAVFPIGSDLRLWNMKPGLFENWNIYDSMEGDGVPWNLHLINTTLGRWKLDFHGVTEIENSNFHLDTFGEARVTVRDSTIVLHHTRGGRVKLVNTLISNSPDLPASMRFLYQPNVTGPNPPYAYEFENSILGPYAELDITDDNICCTFRGELAVQISPDQVHWFGGTVEREYPVFVLDENGAPVLGAQVSLISDDTQLWSGATDENGRVSFNLKFGKDNYLENFVLQATVDNEDVQQEVGFLTSTPVLLSTAEEIPEEGPGGIPIMHVLVGVVAIALVSGLIVALRKVRS